MVGVHCRTRSDFLSNALALPWVNREERNTRKDADDLLAFLDLGAVAEHPAAGLPSARSSGWSWRARWPAARRCCWPTSRRPGSTTRRWARSAPS